MVKFLTTLYCCTPRRIGSIASRGTECRKLTNALSPATVYEMRSAHNSRFVVNSEAMPLLVKNLHCTNRLAGQPKTFREAALALRTHAKSRRMA
jgi:hypothetical protein